MALAELMAEFGANIMAESVTRSVNCLAGVVIRPGDPGNSLNEAVRLLENGPDAT